MEITEDENLPISVSLPIKEIFSGLHKHKKIAENVLNIGFEEISWNVSDAFGIKMSHFITQKALQEIYILFNPNLNINIFMFHLNSEKGNRTRKLLSLNRDVYNVNSNVKALNWVTIISEGCSLQMELWIKEIIQTVFNRIPIVYVDLKDTREFLEAYSHLTYETLIRDYKTVTLPEEEQCRLSATVFENDLRYMSNEDEICEYPDTHTVGRITVRKEDMKYLRPREDLNDIIIDFYLKWIDNNICKKEDFYVFNHLLCRKLTGDYISKIPTKPKFYETIYDQVCVRKKNLYLFSKKYLIFPMNQRNHWYLCIVCNPLEDGAMYMFDSINNTNLDDGKRHLAQLLRIFLTMEHKRRIGKVKEFTEKNLPLHLVKVPQQNNNNDCGLFMLKIAEKVCQNPSIIKTTNLDLRNWFECKEAWRMRTRISNMLRKLHYEQKDEKSDQTI